MLSTPPAFILSQDQTLVKSVCFWSKSLASNFVTLLTVLVLFLNCSLASNCYALGSFASSFMGFAQSSLMQTFESKLSPFPSRSAVLSFQKFSGNSFIVIYCLIINVLCSLATARLEYHSLFLLSTTFFKNFKNFFKQFLQFKNCKKIGFATHSKAYFRHLKFCNKFHQNVSII